MKLPVVSGLEIVKALSKVGYGVDHVTGSHMILRHSGPPYKRLTVPNHPEISKGTLRAILRQAGLSVGELLRLLK